MSISNQLPEWNVVGVEPPQDKKDNGWGVNEKPPADWFNWFFNTTFLALQELQLKALENSGGVPSLLSGTDASKPTASALGRLYVATDTKTIYRDNGTAWDKISAADWSNITGKPTTFTPSAHTHLWADITDKPTTFTPSSHTHPATQITDDSTHRFATDAEKATWNAKQDALGFTPVNVTTYNSQVNQDVRTTASPSFNGLTLVGTALARTRLNGTQLEYWNGTGWVSMSAIKSVQRGVTTVPAGATNVTISAVDMNKTFVNAGVVWVSGGTQSCTAQLTSSTNLQFNAVNSGLSIPWEVIEYA